MSAYSLNGFETAPGYSIEGFESAAGYSTIGVRRRRDPKMCKGKGDTCKGFRVKGEEYCAGHLRGIQAGSSK